MGITDIVEIEKFLQYNCGKFISNKNKSERKKLICSYKNVGSDEIHLGDNFLAYDLSGCSALEVYACYVRYFNYTIQTKFEKERIAVSARWKKVKEVEFDDY